MHAGSYSNVSRCEINSRQSPFFWTTETDKMNLCRCIKVTELRRLRSTSAAAHVPPPHDRDVWICCLEGGGKVQCAMAVSFIGCFSIAPCNQF